jgi:hypothetical protein
MTWVMIGCIKLEAYALSSTVLLQTIVGIEYCIVVYYSNDAVCYRNRYINTERWECQTEMQKKERR